MIRKFLNSVLNTLLQIECYFPKKFFLNFQFESWHIEALCFTNF